MTATTPLIPVPAGAARAAARSRAWIAVALFAVSFGIYVASPVRLQTDSYWTVFTARSLVLEGNADLDEFRSVVDRQSGFQVERLDGHDYYEVPLGTSLFAVPGVAVAHAIDGSGLDQHLADGDPQPFDGWIAAFVCSLSVVVVYLFARRLSTRQAVATTTAIVYAVGTGVWSTASRTMWMHAPSLLCLGAILLVALRVQRTGRGLGALGALLALAYFVRPTNAAPAIAFAIFIATSGRDPFLRLVRGALSVIATFLVLDVLLYGRPLQPYFRASRIGLSGTTVEALVGNLVSPSRGLFVFVPVSLVCVYGFVLKRRSGAATGLDIAVVASAIGYWLLVSGFPHWYGGYAYGPRFLTDIAPFLVWFLPPVLDRMLDRRHQVLCVVVSVTVLASVGIQARGAIEPSTAEWNWTPQDIGSHPGRLWDWSDPQFLR